jgi:hypothetical protein
MLPRWKVGLLGIALAAAPILGCASAPQRERVYVRVAPPPVRREVIVERPRGDYVWFRGHWAWRNGDYVWVPGRWVRRHDSQRWVDGRWVRDRHGWYYIPGYWG